MRRKIDAPDSSAALPRWTRRSAPYRRHHPEHRSTRRPWSLRHLRIDGRAVTSAGRIKPAVSGALDLPTSLLQAFTASASKFERYPSNDTRRRSWCWAPSRTMPAPSADRTHRRRTPVFAASRLVVELVDHRVELRIELFDDRDGDADEFIPDEFGQRQAVGFRYNLLQAL